MSAIQNVLLFNVHQINIPFKLLFKSMSGETVYVRDCSSNAHGVVMMLLEPLSFPLVPGYYFVQLVDAETSDTLFGSAEFAWSGHWAMSKEAYASLGFELGNGMSILQSMRYQAAVMLGKSAVNGRVEVFKDLDGVTDRVTSTTTDDGSRTAVVYHPTPDEQFGMGL